MARHDRRSKGHDMTRAELESQAEWMAGAVADVVLDTPEPDKWIDAGEARPLPMFHMHTLMRYGQKCADAGITHGVKKETAQPARLSDERIDEIAASAPIGVALDGEEINSYIMSPDGLHALAHAIAAAVVPPGFVVVKDWQPIETAPKDGATVIVGRDMGDFGFIRGYARWEGEGHVAGWISCGFDPISSNLGLAHPTHWMPLPPAAKATK